ncbi:hepatic lectin-like, partial [Saccostrea cucullata]|uniref:hepatic lectin-like n=1 Tax=Saccostrea cuccullata TaxID=36930 RepID=UPI002ED4DCF9
FVNSPLKWQAAKASCIWLEAHLLEIESEAEQNLIQNKASGNKWWMGGTDEESEGTFIWVHSNTTLNYTHWDTGEPNNGGTGENCVELLPEGVWNDNNCDSSHYYVCEKKNKY